MGPAMNSPVIERIRILKKVWSAQLEGTHGCESKLQRGIALKREERTAIRLDNTTAAGLW